VEIDPNFDSAHVNTVLGSIAYEQGDMEKADGFIRTAIFSDLLCLDAYKELILINKLKVQKQYKFSMIIPTYNRCAELKRCVRSLRENSFFPVEIIVVSDPCSDGTIEYLEKEESEVGLIPIINETRIGMPKSANRGFRAATGNYVGYINDDAEVMPGWDLSIVVTMDNDLTAGCAAPLVIFPDGRVQSPGQYNPYKSTLYGFIGKAPFIDSTHVVQRHIKDFPEFQVPRECDYGYFPVMKRECFDKAGFFDEQYEHYFIDPDLGYKIQKAGYKTIYCPTSVFVHHELSKRDPLVLNKRFSADLPKFFAKWGLYEYYFYK
jgi:GT2 family glycosyltransferase